MVACVVVPTLIVAGSYYYWSSSQSRLMEQIEQMGASVGKKGEYPWSEASVSDEQLGRLEDLSNLTGLQMRSPHITDWGFRKALPQWSMQKGAADGQAHA